MLFTFYYFPKIPLGSDRALIEYDIPQGSSVKTILKELQAKQILTFFQRVLFRIYIHSQQAETTLQAGEYRFSKAITPEDLLNKWIKGEVILYSLTIPEGITLERLQSILQNHPKIKKESLWPELKEEGSYYPDTYLFPANTSSQLILKWAQEAMQKKLVKAWEERDPHIQLKTPYEALILGSIIEKETAIPQERSIISGVFQRRLAKKMPLQADPTVIYGIRESYQGKLTKEDLKHPTPYNTYLNQGLPPTPIALPGMSSIIAALHPDHSNFLYFVSKGDGTHHFSVTLEEHNKAIKKYITNI